MPGTITCFLIDDDLDDQEIFQLAVKDIDPTIKCMFAQNGVMAMGMLDVMPSLPSIIFLDLNMPRMNGKTFIKQLKDKPQLSHIPVIIYSTFFDNKTEAEMRELGAEGYIEKPPSIKELIIKLVEVFNKVNSLQHP